VIREQEFFTQPVENLQIDFGSNFGVTRASDRINPFVGFTKRFEA